MALNFAPVSQVAAAETPNYLQAELQRARLESANKQKKYQQRQNMLGSAATAYDKFTGEDTPIRDTVTRLVDELRGEDAASEMARSTVPGVGGPGGGSAAAAYQDAAGPAMDTPGMPAMDLSSVADAGMTGAEAGASAGMDALQAGGPAAGSAMQAAEAAEAGADATGGMSGVPLIGALRGGAQLAEGDIGGAAKTGASTYLSTLGPYGIAAGLLLNLLG